MSAHAGNPQFIDRSSNFIHGRRNGEYTAFVESHPWLLDDALFFAIKAEQGGRHWWAWPSSLRDRDPSVLNHARTRHRDAIERFIQEQFAFDRQWRLLREHAHARGVQLFGDLPIYVAHDSAEVWTHRDDYQLDTQGRPTAVSGVPPDYFAKDGQLWGNPLYAWSHMERGGFATWVARMRTQLERFDLVRIDHFRGLEAYWSVPAGAPTARDGQWVEAPGDALLLRLQEVFGRLPLVAEDLGLITPEVIELRDRFDLPGMRVLQFAFDGSQDNPHLPRNHVPNSVAYTGTHDNDTTVGWAQGLDEHTAHVAQEVLSCARQEIPDAMNRAALASVANLAVIPLQDLLGLDSQARMNTPGTTVGNWSWSFEWEQIPSDFQQRWLQHNQGYGRTAGR
jgi:4-alpha-glucanotransferase